METYLSFMTVYYKRVCNILGNPPQPLYPSDQIPPYPTGANSNQPTGAGWVRPSNDAFAPSAPSKAELGDGYGYYGSGNASG